ncbi:Transcriptional regulators [Variovorax sp. HW608]|nr:Transcriptional regulators [Variovorax sp. HW608]
MISVGVEWTFINKGLTLIHPMTPTDPADIDLDTLPGHFIRRLQQIAVAVFLQETEPFGVTPVQYASLQAVRRLPGVDQRSLARSIGLDTSTMAGVIDRLESRGLMVRSASPDDRRGPAAPPDGRGTGPARPSRAGRATRPDAHARTVAQEGAAGVHAHAARDRQGQQRTESRAKPRLTRATRRTGVRGRSGRQASAVRCPLQRRSDITYREKTPQDRAQAS